MAVPGALASSYLIECACPSCKAGDALPERLQGIAGAKQLTFIQPGKAPMKQDYTLFEEDDRVREACRERCADVGDPPCWELNPGDGIAGGVDVRYAPCRECLIECGIEPNEAPDPAAVVRPLL